MARIGTKAQRLFEIKKIGLHVPDFLCFDSERIAGCIDGDGVINDTEIRSIIEEVKNNMPSNRYAVRSSSLLEDGKSSSHAGQFKTCLAVSLDDLHEAIVSVLKHAYFYLRGGVSEFSFFVQEFIEPDYAGVAFTRNPIDGMEMIVNYISGRGDILVAGQKTGKISYINKLENFTGPVSIKKELANFKKLEKHFNAPQDIEWCVKNDRFYYLQCRNITSLSGMKIEQYEYLDDYFSKHENYYFSRVGLAESAPRPVCFTFDLIKRLYEKNGPIERVYQKFGVRYFPKDFLRLIGNQLYLDKERELHTLYPAQSYLLSDSIKQSYASFDKLFFDLKNVYKLSAIDVGNIEDLSKRLASASTIVADNRIEALLKDFFEMYEIVFEINLKADIALNRLDKHEKCQVVKCSQSAPSKDKGDCLLGNSLDVADESAFVSLVYDNSENIKGKISDRLLTYQNFQILREIGRQTVVRKMNKIRIALFDIASKNGFSGKRLIYFAKLDELLENNADERTCLERRKEYYAFNDYNFPSVISNKRLSARKEMFLSEGSASGKLLWKKDLGTEDAEVILYTDVLSPDLAEYFGRIKGIVTENGSILSHLAILARESGIPVLLSSEMKDKIGNTVHI